MLESPDASFAVNTPLRARVLCVRVRPGQSVAQDEPLVDVILPEALSAAGTFAAARLREEAYATRRARLAPLVEQGLARAADLSEVEANLALARSERETVRAVLRVAGVDEAKAASLLAGNGVIALRAPRAAMVVSVSARPGEVREPGTQPLIELASQGEVQIEARPSSTPPEGARFSWISASESLPLVLQALSPRAAREDGTRLAWLRAQDPAHAPLAGSLGRVRIEADPSWKVVPRSAVLQRAHDSAVLVLDAGGQRREQTVQTVMQSNSEAIVSGLSASLRVAADAERVQADRWRAPPPSSGCAPC